jgi:hypothetical protein
MQGIFQLHTCLESVSKQRNAFMFRKGNRTDRQHQTIDFHQRKNIDLFPVRVSRTMRFCPIMASNHILCFLVLSRTIAHAPQEVHESLRSMPLIAAILFDLNPSLRFRGLTFAVGSRLLGYLTRSALC